MERYISYTWGKLGRVNDNWKGYEPDTIESSVPPGANASDEHMSHYDTKGSTHSGSAPTLWNPPKKVAPVLVYSAGGELKETLTVREFRAKFGPVRKAKHDRKTA